MRPLLAENVCFHFYLNTLQDHLLNAIEESSSNTLQLMSSAAAKQTTTIYDDYGNVLAKRLETMSERKADFLESFQEFWMKMSWTNFFYTSFLVSFCTFKLY